MMTNIVMVVETEKMSELSSSVPKVRPELIPTWHHPLDTIISAPPLPLTCHVLITGTFEETPGMITRGGNDQTDGQWRTFVRRRRNFFGRFFRWTLFRLM